jgi:hypothetical protein
LFERFYQGPEETLTGETWHEQEAYRLVGENAIEPVMVRQDYPFEAL